MLDPNLTLQENLLVVLDGIAEAAQEVITQWPNGTVENAVTNLDHWITSAREVAAGVRAAAAKSPLAVNRWADAAFGRVLEVVCLASVARIIWLLRNELVAAVIGLGIGLYASMRIIAQKQPK